MVNNLDLLKEIKEGNEEAKEQFVKENMGLVYAMVKRFKPSLHHKEEIISVGMLGLVKAMNQFDLNYQVAFSTYAVPIILGEIKRYFRDEGSLHVTRSIKDNYIYLMKEKVKFEESEQREIDHYELAKIVNMDIYDVIEAFEANQYVSSLDEKISNEENSKTIADMIVVKEQYDLVLRMSMHDEIKRLSPRDQLLLHYRYELEYNQSKIAEIFHVSQVQISRMEKRILKELRARIMG